MGQLSFQDISKSFGAVRALSGVTFPVAEGEAHALVGENGAGKSTLMRVLAGIVRPDAGQLTWNGQPLDLRSPRDALDRGIGMVYQEMLLFPNLGATENIFAGREVTGGLGRLRKAEMRRRTAALLSDLHLTVRPEAEVGALSAAQQQLLQIARALAFECRILILDEPTTSLTGAETAHLFRVLDRLRSRGVTLIYVSHKLEEVFRLCDRITVLRDGRHIGTFDKSRTSPPEIVRAMVGRDLETPPPSGPLAAAVGAPLLEVSGFTRRPWFEDISLTVHAGEIVALFGLVGSGRSELLETLFGLHRPDRGGARLEGRPVRFGSPVEAVRAGLALVPEERQRQGLFFNLSVRDNLLLPAENAAGRWRRDGGREGVVSLRLIEQWRIGRREPPLRRRHIPGTEVIEARLRIPFLAGTTGSSAFVAQAFRYPCCVE